jgi:hypothetical protein
MMNAINSWIRTCIPARATFFWDQKGSSVLDLIGVAAARSLAFIKSERSLAFVKSNIRNLGILVGIGLTAKMGIGLIEEVSRDSLGRSLKVSLDIWAGLDDSRRRAARRILECYDRKDAYLDLSYWDLNSLPKEIGHLTHLTHLILVGNQLTEIPPEIGCLTNLTFLSLGENQLTRLPEEIGCLTNLTFLSLRQNQLTRLPEEIGCLTGISNRRFSLDTSLFRQVALSPGIANRFLTYYPLLNQEERQAIITQGMRTITMESISMQCAEDVFDAVAAVPRGERDNVITHTLQLINERMYAHDIGPIIRQVAAVPIEARAGYVAARRVANGMAGGARAAAEGVNVHAGNRDQKTKEAIELLRKAQGTISEGETQKYVKEFKAYLHACEHPEQDLARRALVGPRQVAEHFGPLLDGEIFSVKGLTLTGDEVTSRMWLYASTHPEVKEQKQAKEGMILALADSYEHGSMVCNPGKTQRLAIRVLQGRLAGVNIDGLGVITKEAMLAEFFRDERIQKIETRVELISAAEKFANERPAITDELKKLFLEEVTQYADLQGCR